MTMMLYTEEMTVDIEYHKSSAPTPPPLRTHERTNNKTRRAIRIPYTSRPTIPSNSSGRKARYDDTAINDGEAADRLVVVKTSWKLRSEELKQFEELTSATWWGSANVMSTHYPNIPDQSEHFDR